ncbi:MAG: IPT/TIG domain-containing protein [Microscillaceae bacterium]|nr:IPT/TIG domain-containing protein [Microscillaceae bacterium]MDW8460054.1 IPT/TIG domain-containing protein [Cytophagales bacterium]
MKKTFTYLWAFLLISWLVMPWLKAQHIHNRGCYTMENDAEMRAKYPQMGSLQDFENWLQQRIRAMKEARAAGIEATESSEEILIIPTIVHVVHAGEAVGTGRNIPYNQVLSQIKVLNQDFMRTNPDMVNTPINFLPAAANCRIEFRLVTRDPQGNLMPEPGVNRVNGQAQFGISNWSTAQVNSILKPNTIWDPSKYYNMWVVQFSDASLLGFAQFPNYNGIPGIPTPPGPNTDGLTMGYQFFGSNFTGDGTFSALIAPFDRGRTTTHEVGHGFGLRHIWGDVNSCNDSDPYNQGDFCADTPVSNSANFTGSPCTAGSVNKCPAGGVPVPPYPPGSSDLPDMFQNYMDYSDDVCMNLFTLDQKDRMRVVLRNAPNRASLIEPTNIANVVGTIPPRPTFTAFSPVSGPVGTVVTLTGTNFDPTPANNKVFFGNILATVTAATSTSLTVTVPAGVTGSVPIFVNVGVVTVRGPYNYTITALPNPTITSFTPTSGIAGIFVTINGTNFSTNPNHMSVRFGAEEAIISRATATELLVIVPSNTQTSVPITVQVNANSVTSSTNFTYTTATQMGTAPLSTCNATYTSPGALLGYGPNLNIVQTVSPSSSGQALRVTFSLFSMPDGSDKLAIFDGANTSAPLIGEFTGTTLPPVITASNPAGQLTFRLTTNATVRGYFVANLSCVTMPVITSISPTQGFVGTAVTINGANFNATPANNQVRFANIVATILSATTTQIVAVVPAGVPVGLVSVRVTNLAENVTGQSPQNFRVLPSQIISSSPTTTCNLYVLDPGGTGDYGNNQTVTQTFTPENTSQQRLFVVFTEFNLGAGDQLEIFDGANVSAPLIGTYTGTTIPTGNIIARSVNPANTLGQLTFRFTSDAAGVGSGFVAWLRCAGAPVITGMHPLQGPIGTNVTFTGIGFGDTPGANEVRFNNVVANIVSQTATQIVATVPNGVTFGSAPVQISVFGEGTNAPSVFYVVAPSPVITSFSPTATEFGRGTVVTVNGANFNTSAGAMTFRFGSRVLSITDVTANSFKFTVPTDAPVGEYPLSVDVRWTNVPTLTAISTTNFRITDAPVQSVEVFDSSEKVMLYPNPSEGVFRIKVSDANQIQVVVFDALGRKVADFANIDVNYNEASINLTNLRIGTYTLEITVGKQKIYKQVVKY